MRTLVACIKLALFIMLTAVLIVPQMIVVAFMHDRRIAYAIPMLWQKLMCRIIGLKVEVRGEPIRNRQVIYVANHVSYLDIPAIAALIPVSFVAKEDVAHWPVFGLLSKLQQTAFISRARGDINGTKNTLSRMLMEGKSLFIFPEGTSSDGARVLPFKSSLFSIALGDGEDKNHLPVQPVTIEIIETRGRLISEGGNRDVYAWHGDMDLAPHLWGFFKTQGATVRLHFHTERNPSSFADRKELAAACYEDVAAPLNPALARAA